MKEVCNLLKVPESLIHDYDLMLYLHWVLPLSHQHPKGKAVSHNGQIVSLCTMMFLKYIFKIFYIFETDILFTIFVLNSSVVLNDEGFLWIELSPSEGKCYLLTPTWILHIFSNQSFLLCCFSLHQRLCILHKSFCKIHTPWSCYFMEDSTVLKKYWFGAHFMLLPHKVLAHICIEK